jgi:hypothetical protein
LTDPSGDRLPSSFSLRLPFLQQIPQYHAGIALVTVGDPPLLDIGDLRVSAFRADDVDICRFGFLGAVIIGPDRCQRFEARIGENYPFVYNIKVEDVKHSLRAGVSKPASRKKQTGPEVFLAGGVF